MTNLYLITNPASTPSLAAVLNGREMPVGEAILLALLQEPKAHIVIPNGYKIRVLQEMFKTVFRVALKLIRALIQP